MSSIEFDSGAGSRLLYHTNTVHSEANKLSISHNYKVFYVFYCFHVLPACFQFRLYALSMQMQSSTNTNDWEDLLLPRNMYYRKWRSYMCGGLQRQLERTISLNLLNLLVQKQLDWAGTIIRKYDVLCSICVRFVVYAPHVTACFV